MQYRQEDTNAVNELVDKSKQEDKLEQKQSPREVVIKLWIIEQRRDSRLTFSGTHAPFFFLETIWRLEFNWEQGRRGGGLVAQSKVLYRKRDKNNALCWSRLSRYLISSVFKLYIPHMHKVLSTRSKSSSLNWSLLKLNTIDWI